MTITEQSLPQVQIFDQTAPVGGAHERVVFGYDEASGLRAIIAIHNTGLGPALGGTRFYPYASEADALRDVLRLSRGMTAKAAMAGLGLGGGKAVIIGDPSRDKTPALLEAYGRLVESLNGTYITAGDVGTTSEDMDVIGRFTDHVVACTQAAGGSGDSAPLTAYGVFCSLKAAVSHRWGVDGLSSRVVGVEGLGKVGRNLVRMLLADGATVLATDVSASAREQVAAAHPEVRLVDHLLNAELDVYAPCAMGGTLTRESLSALTASVICGAANNQLADPGVEALIDQRQIVWVPDYLANAGGLIQVAGERRGLPAQEVTAQVEALTATVTDLLATASREGIGSGAAADRIVTERLAAAAPVHH